MPQELQQQLQVTFCILLLQEAFALPKKMQQLVNIFQLEIGSVFSDQLHNHFRRRKLPDNTCFADLAHYLTMITAIVSTLLPAELCQTLSRLVCHGLYTNIAYLVQHKVGVDFVRSDVGGAARAALLV